MNGRSDSLLHRKDNGFMFISGFIHFYSGFIRFYFFVENLVQSEDISRQNECFEVIYLIFIKKLYRTVYCHIVIISY